MGIAIRQKNQRTPAVLHGLGVGDTFGHSGPPRPRVRRASSLTTPARVPRVTRSLAGCITASPSRDALALRRPRRLLLGSLEHRANRPTLLVALARALRLWRGSTQRNRGQAATVFTAVAAGVKTAHRVRNGGASWRPIHVWAPLALLQRSHHSVAPYLGALGALGREAPAAPLVLGAPPWIRCRHVGTVGGVKIRAPPSGVSSSGLGGACSADCLARGATS